MRYTIAAIPGDGNGPEIMTEATAIMNTVGTVYGHTFSVRPVTAGTEAFLKGLPPMPNESLLQCENSDAVLLGGLDVGKQNQLPFEKRPESILNTLRTKLSLRSDIRPAFLWDPLKEQCPLKEKIYKMGMDILVVRDIAGGMFAAGNGCRCDGENGRTALDTEVYNEHQIRDTARLAFTLARLRRKKVTSLDKAILLSSSELWRQILTETAKEFPDVQLINQLVDNAALELIEHPDHFDVIVTSNVFGDIISDEVSGLTGIGQLLPAASLAINKKGLFYPNQLHNVSENSAIHGKTNPISIILAVAMMLKYSFGLLEEAESVENSVREVLSDGLATEDFYVPGKNKVTTQQLGEAVRRKITSSKET